LDSWSLFQAGDSIKYTDIETGQTVDLLAPELYPGLFDSEGNEALAALNSSVQIASETFVAVHHSLDGRHLLAIGDSAEIVWFRNYRTQKDKNGRYESVVVLRLEGHGNMLIDNLCIENDRGEYGSAVSKMAHTESSDPVVFSGRVGDAQS
jgi:hypothetical protein